MISTKPNCACHRQDLEWLILTELWSFEVYQETLIMWIMYYVLNMVFHLCCFQVSSYTVPMAAAQPDTEWERVGPG